jgi:hypothetical protein
MIAAISARDEVLCISKEFISFARATTLAIVGFDFFGWVTLSRIAKPVRVFYRQKVLLA